MITASADAYRALITGKEPIPVLSIIHNGGIYIYSGVDVPPAATRVISQPIADGSVLADGSIRAGVDSLAVLGSGRLVKSFGTQRESLSTTSGRLVSDSQKSSADSITVEVLADAIPPGYSMIGARAMLRLGWHDVEPRNWLTRFVGRISKISNRTRTSAKLTILADGGDLLTSLSDALPLATEGNAMRPLVLGDVRPGGTGGQFKLISLDDATGRYAVAGHALPASPELVVWDKDGNTLSGYSIDADNGEITFGSDQSSKEPLTAVCIGLGGASLNPIDAARELLCTVAGWDADEALDAPSWEHAKRVCAAQGYTAGGAVASSVRLGDVLTDLLGSFWVGWRINGDGKLRLLADLAPASLPDGRLALHLSEAIMAKATATESESDICNQAASRWAPNVTGTTEWQGQDDGADQRDVLSQSVHRAYKITFDHPFCRDALIIPLLQQQAVRRWGWPRPLFSVPLPDMRAALVEGGDHITFDAPWLTDRRGRPLINQIGRVEGIALDHENRKSSLTIQDTGLYRTVAYPADGSILADGSHMAGGERLLEDTI